MDGNFSIVGANISMDVDIAPKDSFPSSKSLGNSCLAFHDLDFHNIVSNSVPRSDLTVLDSLIRFSLA